jgi:hypothetical protein
MDAAYLKSTHEIDYRSLGGSRRTDDAVQTRLGGASPAFRAALASLPAKPKDRRARVVAFARDLDRTVGPILSALKPDAPLVWIVGNRHVAGRCIPTDDILTEFLARRGVTPVCRLGRRIASKRMAVKNATTSTMRKETILVMRNRGAGEA